MELYARGKRDFLAVLTIGRGVLCGSDSMCPRWIQVDTTGRKQCVLVLEIVDFVDADTIHGGICDGGIEMCEELLEGFALAAAQHGQGLASFGGDGHGADGVDRADCTRRSKNRPRSAALAA